MTRFSSFLIVGILVTAFASFSTAVPTSASNMTTSVTTAASNTTTAPSNMTTAASNMTTSTSNITTSASNMTTARSNMTTAASNMTTSASNMTTSISNMTAAPSNMTTTPSNMTTSPSNMTTSASNMTTSPSNMTTASGKTSTAPPVTSPGTTSAPEARWSVKDEDGNLCMLMDFKGTVKYTGPDAPTHIPSSATSNPSNCRLSSFAAFVLDFTEDDIIWQTYWRVVLNFTARGSSYQLSEVTVSLNMITSAGYPMFNASSTERHDFFDVPMGDYYTCNSFNQSIGLFELNLTQPSFQPFVQKTKQDSFGEPYACSPPGNGYLTGLLVGVVIAVIIVIIAGIGVTCYVVKRLRKNSNPPYDKIN